MRYRMFKFLRAWHGRDWDCAGGAKWTALLVEALKI
jgi:hypothetical protein